MPLTESAATATENLFHMDHLSFIDFDCMHSFMQLSSGDVAKKELYGELFPKRWSGKNAHELADWIPGLVI